jgi:sugar/nucleoside kinase (ribokinase family)
MKHTIEVTWDQVEHIITSELKFDLETTLDAIEDVKAKGKGFVYSLDAKEDLEQLEAMSLALVMVIKHYGGFDAD